MAVNVKQLYLWMISASYMFAFASMYTQIEGLYGDDGILPVRAFAQIDKRGMHVLLDAFARIPSLVWFGPSIGLSFNSTLQIITLIGLFISFMQLISKSFRDMSMYVIQFIAYFSLFQIGQTFLWFQWDTLLIEAGFLTIFIAPIHFVLIPRKGPHESLTLWTVRWLLFRLMFASGVVKLSSGCPLWWGLTALNVHFESQCLPTPFSWYFHHIPEWFLQLMVIGTYVIEIIVPFLFFIPIKPLRVLAFWAQILLQLMIIITGNYNFFNILTLALCFAILKDSYFIRSYKKNHENGLLKLIQLMITLFVCFGIIYWTFVLFDIKFINGIVKSKTSFDMNQYKQFIRIAIPLSIGIASLSLAANILKAIYKSITLSTNVFNKFRYLLMTILFSCFAIYMFCISLVPHVSLDPTQSNILWPIVKRWHSSSDGFHLVNSYGLFRRITGANGRPEIVIEGSNDLSSGWKEYHFMYKPGDVSSASKFIVPHQPRLDWQLWFAALDNYQNNPWLLHLAYRILTNQKEVIDLLDRERIPFKKPPKYIRMRLYTYRFTDFSSKQWWKRSDSREYISPVSKESLKDFLTQNGIETEKRIAINDQYIVVTNLLKRIRQWTLKVAPHTFVWSLFFTAMLIKSLHFGKSKI